MELNSVEGTRVEKNNIIVGALILLIGIVIGGVFGGGILNNVGDANLQGQAIDSQVQYLESDNQNIPTNEQIDALKNVKISSVVTGTKEELKALYNIDVNNFLTKTPDGAIEKAIDSLSRSIASSENTLYSSNPNQDQINFSCYFSGFGPLQVFEGGFTSYANNWWSTPSGSNLTVCIISSIW